ncbi:heme-degrading domain-containing protein [Streptomyces sp. NPDC051569]|uniref:heme-degrading domain-containing protein n=1 Tax=Streptomyces sp. NPDC051569 TaxID=3365661 RepID=UPI0037BB7E56
MSTPANTPPVTPPAAPPVTVADIEAQEARLVLSRFTHEDAWTLGGLLAELARERELPVTVDIHLDDRLVFRSALPGSSVGQDSWIERKRRVVAHYGVSSFLVGARFRAEGTTFEESSGLAPELYAAHGGSFPITVQGQGIVGTVTVSGLPQAEDHALAVEALDRLPRG